MMASVVLVAAGLGIYVILIRAYELVALTRYRDDARAVLQTFASQFQRLQTADVQNGTNYPRIFFQTTGVENGAGLRWDSTTPSGGSNLNLDSLCTEPGFPGGNPAEILALTVHIGGTTNGIDAYVTRSVVQIGSDGQGSSTPLELTSAGQMLLATFRIRYSVYGLFGTAGTGQRQITQSLSVLRAAP
jgi:hypothetical protein